MKSLRFFLTQHDLGIIKMLNKRGHTITEDIYASWDCAIFPGGEDVTPFLYGDRMLPHTVSNFARDLEENRLFRSMDPSVPKIGICRGAQFLNVMNGGALWQHVDGHALAGGHLIHDYLTGDMVHVTSTHHQMMIPTDNGDILAVAKEARHKARDKQRVYPGERTEWEDADDVEVAFYEQSNSLCFQPHPEYTNRACEEYFWYLFDMQYSNDIKKRTDLAKKGISDRICLPKAPKTYHSDNPHI